MAVDVVERAREVVERARAFERLVVVAMRSRYPRPGAAPGSDTRSASRYAMFGQLPAMFSDAATLNGAIPASVAWR